MYILHIYTLQYTFHIYIYIHYIYIYTHYIYIRYIYIYIIYIYIHPPPNSCFKGHGARDAASAALQLVAGGATAGGAEVGLRREWGTTHRGEGQGSSKTGVIKCHQMSQWNITQRPIWGITNNNFISFGDVKAIPLNIYQAPKENIDGYLGGKYVWGPITAASRQVWRWQEGWDWFGAFDFVR